MRLLKIANLARIPLRSQATTVTVNKNIGRWLLTCAGLTFGAITIGGITRLTESGLSIVEWNVVSGIFFPLSNEAWQKEFDKYKEFPQFKQMPHVDIWEFKKMWFWEYIHRMIGRVVGFTFLIPAIYFWKTNQLTRGLKIRALIFGGLIGLEGIFGWMMVRSGLKDQEGFVRVSPYNLALHLMTATFLYVGLLYNGLVLTLKPRLESFDYGNKLSLLNRKVHKSMLLTMITLFTGALVAGRDAGLLYNSWPKMGDHWVPPEIFDLKPTWINLLENDSTVQFNHRILGKLTLLYLLYVWYSCCRNPLPGRARIASHLLPVFGVLQVALGIMTLLTYVNTHVAATHQTNSVLLLSTATWLATELRKFPK